jgi:hypothetical protein
LTLRSPEPIPHFLDKVHCWTVQLAETRSEGRIGEGSGVEVRDERGPEWGEGWRGGTQGERDIKYRGERKEEQKKIQNLHYLVQDTESGMESLGYLMIPCLEAHLSCSPMGVECQARSIFRYIMGSEYTPPSMNAAPITVCCTILEGAEEYKNVREECD